MKKTNQLTNKEEKRLTPAQERKLRETLPRWAMEAEDRGTSMMQTAQEFLQLTEELLRRHHNFSEKEIIQFESELKETLPVLHQMELKGFSILTPNDMQAVGQIAEIRRQRLNQSRTGIALPTEEEIKKLK